MTYTISSPYVLVDVKHVTILDVHDTFNQFDSMTYHFVEGGNDMNLSIPNYVKYHLQWMEDS